MARLGELFLEERMVGTGIKNANKNLDDIVKRLFPEVKNDTHTNSSARYNPCEGCLPPPVAGCCAVVTTEGGCCVTLRLTSRPLQVKQKDKVNKDGQVKTGYEGLKMREKPSSSRWYPHEVSPLRASVGPRTLE